MGRAKQLKLVDTDDPKHADLIEMAEEYMALRDARMAALRPEVEQKEKVITEMKRLKLKEFERDGMTIEIVSGKEKLKVRRAGDEEGDE